MPTCLRAGMGLALRCRRYQKRALPVIAWLADLARRQRRRIPVRLVKGAYWDTEIKRAQELGLADYPVFTRKSATDTSYLACARALFGAGDAIFPQFATHNAHTLSAIQVLARERRDFEYQRLHGMGEMLYELYRDVKPPAYGGAGTRIYAPVGSHEDLLAYLVRRLLENGANTSFVNRLADEQAPIEAIIADPVAQLAAKSPRRNPHIPKPENLFPDRKNSHGFLWSDPEVSAPMLRKMEATLAQPQHSGPIVGGSLRWRNALPVRDPSDHRRIVGEVVEANADDIKDALDLAHKAQHDWNAIGGEARAEILERAADLIRGASRPSDGAGRARSGKDIARSA